MMEGVMKENITDKVRLDFQSKNKQGNPNWSKGMPSPNNKGRPKGIVDNRLSFNRTFANEIPEIIDQLIIRAKEGDTQAASLILSRSVPVLRAQGERVQCEFDAKASVSEQANAILQAISDGQLSPDAGKEILEAISIAYGIKQFPDFEARLNILEGKEL